MTFVLGADIGGSNLRVRLSDLAGRPVAEARATTPPASGAAVVADLAGLAQRVFAGTDASLETLMGVGVGIAGVASRAGDRVSLAPNLPPLEDVDLAEALRGEFGVPVAVDNDVNVATLAELRQGRGAGVSDLVFIAVGTGIGMGIVASNDLQRGAHGAAGEIASLPLGAEHLRTGRREAGSLEAVAGGAALKARYRERTGADVAAAEVFDRADGGDGVARDLVDEQAEAVAVAVLSVESVLDPALVVLGGGIGRRADFLPAVQARLEGMGGSRAPIAASGLGDSAGVLGACLLASERIAATESASG